MLTRQDAIPNQALLLGLVGGGGAAIATGQLHLGGLAGFNAFGQVLLLCHVEQRDARHLFQVQPDGIFGGNRVQVDQRLGRVIRKQLLGFLFGKDFGRVRVEDFHPLAAQQGEQCFTPVCIPPDIRIDLHQIVRGEVALNIRFFKQHVQNLSIVFTPAWIGQSNPPANTPLERCAVLSNVFARVQVQVLATLSAQTLAIRLAQRVDRDFDQQIIAQQWLQINIRVLRDE